MSEALTAEVENGSSAAVKTKIEKCFIVSYSLKEIRELEERIKERLNNRRYFVY